jgi:hypothetical protein
MKAQSEHMNDRSMARPSKKGDDDSVPGYREELGGCRAKEWMQTTQ